MADSFLPLLAALISALKANGTISGLVGTRVYSDVPDNPTFPFIVVRISSMPFDTKTTSDMYHDVQISMFKRRKTPAELGNIRAAVYSLLHKQESSFSATGVSAIIFTGTAPVFKEPDGKTWHCPMIFRVTVS